jgi:hypothetical protein
VKEGEGEEAKNLLRMIKSGRLPDAQLRSCNNQRDENTTCGQSIFQTNKMDEPNPARVAPGLNWKANLKLVASAGLITARGWLGLWLAGLWLNWGFALAFGLTRPQFTSWHGWILLVFSLLMPIPYFLVGKAYGLRSGLSYVFNHKKAGFIEYLLQKMLQTGAEKTLSYQKLQDLLANSGRWLGKLPRWVRALAQFFINRVPFGETLLEVAQSQELTEGNLATVSQAVAEKIDERSLIFEPSRLPFWGLLGGNLLLMAAAWGYGH